MGEKLEPPNPSQEAMGMLEETARSHVQESLSATLAQRLAWLEEALELAYRNGVLPKTKNESFGPENTEKKKPIILMTS